MELKLAGLEGKVKVTRIEPLVDDRGRLSEPVDDSDIRAGNVLHVHIVECAPGTVRANHLHQKSREVLCLVAGDFLVKVRDPESGVEAQFEVPDGQGVKVEVEAGIAHAFKNVGTSTGYILGYSDKSFDESDIERCQLLDRTA
jgi:dTDP-4-dehydrorhamnose 3,5-epimerase-like enzyme